MTRCHPNRYAHTNPYECRCGYAADSARDLDEHVVAMCGAGDDRDHGAVR